MTRLYTANQIAEAIGKSKQSVFKRLKSVAPDKAGRNRKHDYAILPADYQRALDDWEHRKAHAGDAPEVVALPAPAPPPRLPTKRAADGSMALRGQVRKPKSAADMNDKDRAYQEAALTLCRTVDSAILLADCSETRAIVELGTHLTSGNARVELLDAAHATYLKPRKNAGFLGGESAQISRLRKMMSFYRMGMSEGDAGKYLIAGRPQKIGQKPEDMAAFLRHYCRPHRPSVSEAWKAAADWYTTNGFVRPSVYTWYRIEREQPVTLKYRGRMTGAAYTALLPYIVRDVSMFKANDLWVGDGHTFKARIQSPLTGKAFRPEVTVIMDWVSRKIVGWSVDMAESTIAVSAALRHAQIQTRARPLVYYSDKGSGQTGKKIDHPVTGTASRQGFDHQTGIPGHPQARGIIERLWPTVLMTLAKTYPTFLNKDADRDTIRKVGQQLAKADRAGEDSPLLPSFEQFVSDLQGVIDAYNSGHIHSSLGGKTPDQAYAEKLDPDSIVFGLGDSEIRALWMPEEIRSHERGVVSLFNNRYFRADLVDRLAEKEKLRVRFDIHDAAKVLLFRMDGTEIGEAEFEGNKRAAFPVSYIERKRDERAEDIIGRANKEIERAEAERGRIVEGDACTLGPEDFIAVQPKPAPEPEQSYMDFLPTEKAEKPSESSFEDTVMWLYCEKKEEDGEESSPVKELAAE